MTPDFLALRRRFPLLARRTYLNSGSYGALADTVHAAIEAYLEERLVSGANWDLWVAKNESVRARLARLFDVSSTELAITASASAGINALASAIEFHGPRDTVVLSDLEFPTQAQIWHAQEHRGARVVHAHCAADGNIPLAQFERLIDARTRLVALTHVCYRNGVRLDIPAIVRLAHERGAQVLLDTYQAAGALAIDPAALGVDFMVGGLMKYLLGTAGIGFLYVREALVPQLVPTHSGWMAQQDVAAMDITANRPAMNARRFEAGTPPVVNCYAAEAGLELILEVGSVHIERRIRDLTRSCMERLAAIGWSAVTPLDDARRGPMVAIPSRHAGDLCARLLDDGIVTSPRDNNVRASFHFYNSEEDVERLVTALARYRRSHLPT
ncbi:MAG: aminotransferase class V-fold PLP-dependent enzyme [Pseudomonadota bacterium]|jgi:selenocysteine lyase/cysteine desulfurase|nr:aminotransferase class V-fold PLP-dependent enzyme [Pseudomonadota bacterium]